ncbi:hypothetical protein ES703_76100 [subsurface metagenome]
MDLEVSRTNCSLEERASRPTNLTISCKESSSCNMAMAIFLNFIQSLAISFPKYPSILSR